MRRRRRKRSGSSKGVKSGDTDAGGENCRGWEVESKRGLGDPAAASPVGVSRMTMRRLLADRPSKETLTQGPRLVPPYCKGQRPYW